MDWGLLRKSDKRSAVSRKRLESVGTDAVKSASACAAFVGVVIQRIEPKSRWDPNWAVRGVRFGKADRDNLGKVLVLLRHNFSPRSVPCDVGSATWTSRQDPYERIDQSYAHGGDRVRDVTFRPQGRILWVGNRWVWQVPGAAWRDEVLRGESSPSRRSGIRRLRCTAWRDDESRASRVPHSVRARPLA